MPQDSRIGSRMVYAENIWNSFSSGLRDGYPCDECLAMIRPYKKCLVNLSLLFILTLMGIYNLTIILDGIRYGSYELSDKKIGRYVNLDNIIDNDEKNITLKYNLRITQDLESQARFSIRDISILEEVMNCYHRILSTRKSDILRGTDYYLDREGTLHAGGNFKGRRKGVQDPDKLQIDIYQYGSGDELLKLEKDKDDDKVMHVLYLGNAYIMNAFRFKLHLKLILDIYRFVREIKVKYDSGDIIRFLTVLGNNINIQIKSSYNYERKIISKNSNIRNRSFDIDQLPSAIFRKDGIKIIHYSPKTNSNIERSVNPYCLVVLGIVMDWYWGIINNEDLKVGLYYWKKGILMRGYEEDIIVRGYRDEESSSNRNRKFDQIQDHLLKLVKMEPRRELIRISWATDDEFKMHYLVENENELDIPEVQDHLNWIKDCFCILNLYNNFNDYNQIEVVKLALDMMRVASECSERGLSFGKDSEMRKGISRFSGEPTDNDDGFKQKMPGITIKHQDIVVLQKVIGNYHGVVTEGKFNSKDFFGNEDGYLMSSDTKYPRMDDLRREKMIHDDEDLVREMEEISKGLGGTGIRLFDLREVDGSGMNFTYLDKVPNDAKLVDSHMRYIIGNFRILNNGSRFIEQHEEIVRFLESVPGNIGNDNPTDPNEYTRVNRIKIPKKMNVTLSPIEETPDEEYENNNQDPNSQFDLDTDHIVSF